MTKPSDLIKLSETEVLQLSEIVDTTKKNYAISYEIRVQLESLQEWIRAQAALYKKD